MEGVGARLGRSSTRYGGPITVFTGPVRRWKKKWIHVTPPTSGNNHQRANGRVNGSNDSHLLLFKWTPITASQNNNGTAGGNGEKNDSPNDDAVAVEELPKRKFKLLCLKNKTTRNLNMTMKQNQLRLTQMVGGQHWRLMVLMKILTSIMCRWKKVRLHKITLQNDKI
uniref:Uncharacterized protein isoform X2 n=1 Tax=Nicotiana tabacum TaxID=4097 RepID=A0A1S3ZF38_TOBAC|nr:PREDICTED: uncharacterized protein LOC107786148 isoform X2 [Nicotiana tabacum]